MQGIFRKENTDKALKYGIYRHLPTYEKIIRNLVSFYSKDNVFAYKRVFEGKEILVVANFGQEDITLEMEKEYQVLLNNMEECEMANNKLVIKSTQVLVLK